MSPSSRKLEVIADPDKPTIVTRRTFDAPRALVFDAWTKPELMKRWLGPRALEMVLCEVDLRVGGGYRYVHRAPDGQEFGFHGTYREIARPDRLVSTFVFELFPDAEAVDTLELEERDGKTTAPRPPSTSRYRPATATSPRAWKSAWRRATRAWTSCCPR